MNLTPELWTRAKDLFEDALRRDLSPEARSAFLKTACPDNDFVRAEVEALLIEHERAGDFLESAPLPAFGLPLAVTDQPGARVCPKCSLCFDGDCEECLQDGTPLTFAFPGSRLIDNKYLVERQLGEGGMGTVYCAYHLGLARRFAVKIMSTATGASSVFLERFEMEARVLGRLKHPNIVDVTDYGVDPREGGMPYLVMEYLEGSTLEEVCHRGAYPVKESLTIVRSVAEAVDAAHELGVLHGDLKPANIFLTKATAKDNAGSVKILDFGLSRLTEATVAAANGNGAGNVSQSKSRAGSLIGTPAYMAPELFSSETTTRASDIYSLGVIAYRLLTGKLPSDASEDRDAQEKCDPPAPSKVVEIAKTETTNEPDAPPIVELPAEMDAPVMAMLAENPAQRPASAVAAISAIEKSWSAAKRRQWIRREIPRRIVLAAVLAPLLAGLALLLGRVGWIQNLEWQSEDFRFVLAPKKQPDPRIVMVSIDESSLAGDSTPLSQRADEFSGRLEEIFAAGASRVAVDIAPPPNWNTSATFSRMVLQHADALTLGLMATTSGSTGAECVTGLTAAALGPRFSSLFAFVNLPADADGRIRNALFYRDSEGVPRETLACAVANTFTPERSAKSKDEVRIDYSIDWRQIPRLSWKDLPAVIAHNSQVFRNKVVVLGAEFEGSGDEHFRIPGDKNGVSGLVLQTLIANTMLEQDPARPAGFWQIFFIAAFGGWLSLFAAVCLRRRLWGIGITCGVTLAYLCAAWILFRSMHMLIPIVVPMAALALGIILGMLVRQKLVAFPR